MTVPHTDIRVNSVVGACSREVESSAALRIQQEVERILALLTVDRAFHLLRLIVFDGSLSISEAAEACGTSTSSAYRLLRTLSNAGVIERDPESGKFRTGPELLRMSATILNSADIRQASLESLRILSTRWKQTVTLCIRTSNDQVLYLDRVASPRWLKYVVPLGEVSDLHIGSAGRVILAYLRPEEVDRILGHELSAYTAGTITDPAVIRERIPIIRERGYAVSRAERVEDAIGISAPIFDIRGIVIGSLLMSIPEAHREEIGDLDVVGSSVREEADRVSLRLGWIAE